MCFTVSQVTVGERGILKLNAVTDVADKTSTNSSIYRGGPDNRMVTRQICQMGIVTNWKFLQICVHIF